MVRVLRSSAVLVLILSGRFRHVVPSLNTGRGISTHFFLIFVINRIDHRYDIELFWRFQTGVVTSFLAGLRAGVHISFAVYFGQQTTWSILCTRQHPYQYPKHHMPLIIAQFPSSAFHHPTPPPYNRVSDIIHFRFHTFLNKKCKKLEMYYVI